MQASLLLPINTLSLPTFTSNLILFPTLTTPTKITPQQKREQLLSTIVASIRNLLISLAQLSIMVKSENNKLKKEPSKSLGSKSVLSTAASDSNIKKKYKGVRMRSWGSYVSEIRAPNQKTRIWLGSYSTPEAAARAYDAALLCLKGSSANLNFPLTNSSHYIPQDTTMSPKSIQRVAAAAANSFIDTIASCTSPSSLPPSTSSSSSSVSSPSVASSSSDQIDDGGSLFEAYDYQANESMAMMESWYGLEGLQSPKYVDQMLNASFFDIGSSHLIDDLYEEGDIRLWSFS